MLFYSSFLLGSSFCSNAVRDLAETLQASFTVSFEYADTRHLGAFLDNTRLKRTSQPFNMASFTEVQHETLCHNLTMTFSPIGLPRKSGRSHVFVGQVWVWLHSAFWYWVPSTSIEFQLLCRRGPVSVEGALYRYKQPTPDANWKLGGLHFINVFQLETWSNCWYSNVFGHQAQSAFESTIFVLGKWHSQHLPWRTFRHFKQLKIYLPDLKIRGPLKFTEKRLDLVGHNTSRFWGDDGSILIWCNPLRLSTHEGALGA